MAIEYRVINGAVYAMISRSIREGDKVVKAPCFNLCRVIDKENQYIGKEGCFSMISKQMSI